MLFSSQALSCFQKATIKPAEDRVRKVDIRHNSAVTVHGRKRRVLSNMSCPGWNEAGKGRATAWDGSAGRRKPRGGRLTPRLHMRCMLRCHAPRAIRPYNLATGPGVQAVAGETPYQGHSPEAERARFLSSAPRRRWRSRDGRPGRRSLHSPTQAMHRGK